MFPILWFRAFLILWLRVFLIWIKYKFFFKIFFRSGCSWKHPDLYVAPPLQTIFSHSYFSFQREREREREREIPWGRAASTGATEHRSAICDLRSMTICDEALATSDDEGWISDESTSSRQGRRATERAVPASVVTGASCASPWVWFALGLGFGFLCIGFFFFFLINKSVLQYWVMGFGLLLLCMDCIWFSLPTTWLWIDFWFALYWFFFFSFFFFWVRIHGFATSGLCWAWLAVRSGLGSVTNFFFFFGLKVEQIIFFFF